MEQEQALQMVAAHDAGALEDALSRGLAAIGVTTARLIWVSNSRSAMRKPQQQTMSEGLRQGHTVVYSDTDAAAGTQGVHATPNAQNMLQATTDTAATYPDTVTQGLC